VLSVVFGLFHKLGVARWLVAIPLLVIGVLKGAQSGLDAAIWWLVAAGLLLLMGWVADAAGFMFFVADDLLEVLEEAPSGTLVAIAGGWFRTREGYDWHLPEREEALLVQLRWLAGEKPPALAVLTPDDMPERTREPLMECRCAALWHPGVQVRTGWVTVGWHLHPGLELEFIGRRMRIALDRPGHVRAIARLLAESA
jgi:hypothetical protein